MRAVVKLKPEGAAAALIGFLPLADTEAVADVIREALTALAVQDGKADPALVAALADKSPVRRAAAYVALTEGGPPTERIRIKDAYPKFARRCCKEADLETKFARAVVAGHDHAREGVRPGTHRADPASSPRAASGNSKTCSCSSPASTPEGRPVPEVGRVAGEGPRRVAGVVEGEGRRDRPREVRVQAARRRVHRHHRDGQQRLRPGAASSRSART